ncbi:type IV pilus secretin PilQ [Rhodanobacter sp. DHG33]|uniref:type IV pilus secretin PilQ n=1 Tax=Rhodanobacter sp. DHG33 TaxID=2775921 RepID=UPI00177B343D|nr:type IV pilus secretin PilQ [Rhodanobacter sp. DHG33]MBD8897468.1 type IV pilus secretin PilQ [Rhodanobacter sp. DHG33]
MRHTIRCLLSLLLFAGACFSQVALAASSNTLKDISYTTLPNGSVQLHLNFTGAVPQPRIFTTGNPARIAVDFSDADTTAQRHTAIGQGAVSGVSAVSAGGRTRVIVELMQSAPYQSAVEGNSLVLTVDNGTAQTAATPAPVQHSVTTAAVIDPSKRLPTTAEGAISVSNIDFRRGADGQGRVLISFSGPGADAQMHTIGDKVEVSVPNASVPANLAQRLDTLDFATPVQSIDTRNGIGGGVHMTIATKGVVDTSAWQEGNQYVVEVAPKKSSSAAVNASQLAMDQHPAYTGTRATFNFQDIPVRSVLQLIADTSHLNVVAADSVNGSITLRLVNVPWDQALDVILRAKGLDKRRDGDVIWVAPQEELAKYEQDLAIARMKAEDNAPLITSYIPISYGKAADIAKLLTSGSLQGTGGSGGTQGGVISSGFLSPRGSVSFDIRTNTLLLNDTAEKTEQIRKLVATLDKPVQQVLIESRIVIASDTFTRSLGVQWGAYGQQTNSTYNQYTGQTTTNNVLQIGGGVGGTTLGWTTPGGTGTSSTSGASSNPGLNVNLPSSTSTTPAGALGFAILGKNYALDLELSAAQTEGTGEVISSPRVITSNQQEADIRQGQEIGYVTYQGGVGGTGGVTGSVQFKDAVLELKVTPTITADNRVYLAINVTKDSLAQFLTTPNGQVPEINTQSVNTSVLVDNGQTVVLGGIYEVDKSNTVTKVPGLGDIPVLGSLFRSTSRNDSKAELLIFVTPRILNDSLQ